MKILKYPILECLSPTDNDKHLPSEKSMFEPELSISYITDLHLDHFLEKKYPHGPTRSQAKKAIQNVIKNLEKEFSNNGSSLLLIGGDVSDNFALTYLFYSLLVKAIPAKKIISILGNHELWDEGITKKAKKDGKSIFDSMVINYESMFRKLEITFLHNNILAISGPFFSFIGNPPTVTAIENQQLLKYHDHEFRDEFDENTFFIMGGLGFSANCKDFNATNDLYNESIRTIEEDKALTNQFASFYAKVESLLGNTKVIVFTHTPMNNWIDKKGNNHWVYLNGHTHQNMIIHTSKVTIIADNQAGYNATSYHLKHFYVGLRSNQFAEYEDGIHKIKKKLYPYNSDYIDDIYMLKKDGLFCFIGKNNENSRLYFMNDRKPSTLKKEHPLDYYYEKMEAYSNAIDSYLNPFTEYINQISSFVRSFGGDGHVHGCIIDVDTLNHLYVNPFDKKVTPYYADSKTDKYIYKNLSSLLKFQLPSAYKNYQKMENASNNNQLINWNSDSDMVSKETLFLTDTSMYRYSEIIRTLQYKNEIKVIRLWNDWLLEKGEINNLLENTEITEIASNKKKLKSN